MKMLRWVLVWVVLGCFACSDDADGGSTPAQTNGGETSADVGVGGDSGTSDGGEDTGEGETCSDDALSPSSSDQPASLIEAADAVAMVACPDVGDWLSVPLSAGQTLTVALESDPLSRVQVQLLGAETGLEVGTSTVDPDNANRGLWSYTPRGDEEVMLSVAVGAGSRQEYTLDVDIADPVDPCAESPEEPNDTRNEATLLELNTEFTGRLCRQERDWFTFSIPPDHTASILLSFAHNQGAGDLDMRLFDTGDTPLQISESATDDERIFLDAEPDERIFMLDVYGYRDAEAPYTLTIVTFGPSQTEATVQGTVTYDNLLPTQEGLAQDATQEPLWGGIVQVIRRRDGAPVGRAVTDETGAYSVTFPTHEGQEYAVRAPAAVSVGPWEGAVRDRTDAFAVYALASEFGPADGLEGSPVDLHASLDLGGLAGSFNIADTVGDAYRFILQYTDQAAPALTVWWQAGEPFSCGSCYSDNRISLGGQVEDTDEFDDAIILHEFGHYFFDHFGRDSSPGGPHRGRQVSPQLAYGEGIAYFFSGLVVDDPITIDTFIDGTWVIDLERATQDGETPDNFNSTEDGTLSGNLREEVISTILWDAYDEASDDEPFDQIAIGEEGHMALFLGPLAELPEVDQGARGIDLSDWLNAFGCAYPDLAPLLPEVVEVRAFPWEPEDAPACSQKGTEPSPYTVERTGDFITLDTKAPAALPETVHIARVALKHRRTQPLSWERVACSNLPCSIPALWDDDHATLVRIQTTHSKHTFTHSVLTRGARARLTGDSQEGAFDATFGAVRLYRAR